MPSPFRVMFVCVGNVCRSPVAERLMQHKLEKLGVRDAFSVGSAGTRALVGQPMTHESAAELSRRGGSPEGFVARRLHESMLRSADLVLTATTNVRRTALEEAPSAMRRTFTWREFAALVHRDVAESPAALVADASARRAEVASMELDTEDPIGRSADVYARAAIQIDDAVTPIALALAASAAHL